MSKEPSCILSDEMHKESLRRLKEAFNNPIHDPISNSQREIYKMLFEELRYKGFWYDLTDFLGLRSSKSNWCFDCLWGKKENSDGSIGDETYEKK